MKKDVGKFLSSELRLIKGLLGRKESQDMWKARTTLNGMKS